MSKGPHILEAHADVFRTRVGAAFPGSHAVFRGHDLHRDLTDLSWQALCAFGITGRRIPEAHLKWFEAAWVNTSYPDARLWNNRVAALGGTTRSTPNLAISAAQAMSEAALFGRGNEFRALDFFIKTRKALAQGTTLAAHLDRFLAEGGRMAGYGRPIASHDERIPVAMALGRELGVADGPFVKLAFEIDRYFEASNRPLRLNMGGLVAAYAGDFGWSPQEFNMMVYASFLAGMFPCYVEATEKPPGAVFPIRCADVRYEGRPHREWRSDESI
jgi:hypothetical protein